MPFPEPTHLIDRELIFKFFWRFAAIEAALIAERNLHAWDSPPFRRSATALLECNVHRQVIKDGYLSWEPLTPSGSAVAFTIESVICVRNTMFHGGKFSGGGMEIARDKRILQAALSVLNECYELHEGIRRAVGDIAEAA
jgi:hypothetical protein